MKSFVYKLFMIGIVLAILPFLAPSNAIAQDPYNFTYNNTNYSIVYDWQTWEDAAAWAKKNGGKLVEINDQKEQDAIWNELLDNVDTWYTEVGDGGGIAYVWIGANDLASEGTWVWDGDDDGVGSNFWIGQGWAGDGDGYAVNKSFVYWGGAADGETYEPDNFQIGKQTQNAAAIALSDWPWGYAGEWNDINENNQLYFVVEYSKINPPTNLVASINPKDVSVTLNWVDNTTDETGFTIERTDGTNKTTFTVNANVTSYIDATVYNGVKYTYTVRAYTSQSTSDWSKPAIADINLTVATPTNFIAKVATDKFGIQLTWNDNATNETSYVLYRIYGSDTTKFNLTENANSYFDNSVSNTRTYTYRLKAYNSKIQSTWVTLQPITINLSLLPPTNLVAVYDYNYHYIKLTWNDNSNNESGFIIRKIVDGTLSYIRVPANTNSYYDYSVTPTDFYVYDVQAQIFDVILSSFSNKAYVGENTSIMLEGYSDEIIECAGKEDMQLYVAAQSTDGNPLLFQWFKDGHPIMGETSEILDFKVFDHSVSGVYECMVYQELVDGDDGSGTGNGEYLLPEEGYKMTGKIPVYALTTPEIIGQPEPKIYVAIGSDYNFDIQVHYRGIIPPLYKDDFQWYKVDATGDTLALTDNDKISGAKASILSFRDIQDDLICKKGEFYFAKVISQCGIVYSDPFIVSAIIDIVFRDHPQSKFTCPGEDIVLTATAKVPTGFEIEYKWLKDAQPISDNAKFNGTATNILQIYDVQEADAANYSCLATIKGEVVNTTSLPAVLTIKEVPQANAKDASMQDVKIKRGNDVTFQATMTAGTSNNELEVWVKWLHKDQIVKEGKWSQFEGDKLLTLTLKEVDEDIEGLYICEITNECSKAEVEFNLDVTKWDEINSVSEIRKNGYAIFANMPNPVSNSTLINFEVPKTVNTIISLFDINGNEVAVLFDGIANEGVNSINVNISSLNLSNGTYYYMIKSEDFNALMHIAYAFNVPQVAIFGSTVKEFGFLPDYNKIKLIENDIQCRPCTHIGRSKCPKRHFKCMIDIHTDEIVTAILNLLS